MKKFNVSLIIPIFYITAVTLAALFLLVIGFKIWVVGAVPIIALNLAAVYQIDFHNIDLKHNLIAYIISVIISFILIVISYTVFDAFFSPLALWGIPIVNIILITLGFYFDKDRKEHEVLVWFLLNPNIYYIIALFFLWLELWYVQY